VQTVPPIVVVGAWVVVVVVIASVVVVVAGTVVVVGAGFLFAQLGGAANAGAPARQKSDKVIITQR